MPSGMGRPVGGSSMVSAGLHNEALAEAAPMARQSTWERTSVYSCAAVLAS